MNKQRKVVITTTYNEMGIIIDTKAEEVAQPERKKGKWLQKEVADVEGFEEVQVAKCSVCDRYLTTPYIYHFSDYNFCPFCGADMRGEEDEAQG